MQIRTTSFLITSLVLFLSVSCSNNTTMKGNTNTEKEISNTKVEKGYLKHVIHGKWRIDSVAENNIVINRLIKDTIIQVFNFRKNGEFTVIKVEATRSMERVIGRWKIKKDSLFMLGTKGGIAMRYGWEFNKPVLTLNANFQATSTNKNKPSFYLSKYTDKW